MKVSFVTVLLIALMGPLNAGGLKEEHKEGAQAESSAEVPQAAAPRGRTLQDLIDLKIPKSWYEAPRTAWQISLRASVPVLKSSFVISSSTPPNSSSAWGRLYQVAYVPDGLVLTPAPAETEVARCKLPVVYLFQDRVDALGHCAVEYDGNTELSELPRFTGLFGTSSSSVIAES
jgi:hypothetical protein